MNNRVTTSNEILNEISRAISQHKSRAEILNISVQMIADFFAVELCNIYTYDKRTDRLTLVATQGFDDNLVGKISLATNEGLVGYVFFQQQTIQLISPHKSEHYYYIEETKEENFHSFMGFPIISHNRCWGVLTLQCQEKKILPIEDRELIETLSLRLSAILVTDLCDFSSSENSREKNNKLQGFPASTGVALGRAYLHKSHVFWENISYQVSLNTEEELNHLNLAIEAAKEETIKIQVRATELFVEADASIFFSQLMFLEDQTFIEQIILAIKEQKQTALSSVKKIVQKQINLFLEQDNEQLADRVTDLLDIGIRIAKHLVEDFDEGFSINHTDSFVLVVDNLMPSDLLYFEIKNILGIVCRIGGITSHATILACSLNIPVVMGVTHIFDVCSEGVEILVDANEGIVYINPDNFVLEQYQNINKCIEPEILNDDINTLPKTTDGRVLKLRANINLSNEMKLLNKIYHDGIGLYRSEFMFMVNDKFPSEAEQYRIYNWLTNCIDKSITIRILDIGGDKQLPYFEMDHDDTSMLGWRSIRLLFDKKEVFIPHLRALLRVSQKGNVRLLFPMIAHSQDMKMINNLVDEVLQDLNIQYNRDFKRPPIGAMIEIPSAVWQVENILQFCDFVSIGTNDLLQYLFAVDRGNRKVSSYFAPMHPAILQALQYVESNCQRLNKPVSICGEMAGNIKSVPLLLGLGFSDFSMVPSSIYKIKKLVQKLAISDCQKLVQQALLCSSDKEVENLVDNFLR